MTFQQFAEELEQNANPSPLLKALQALRTRSLEELRDSEEFPGYSFLGWVQWPSPYEATPAPSV